MRESLRLRATEEAIAPALNRLEGRLRAAGIGKDLTLEMRLLAEEALTNIVKYAHDAPGDHRIDVTLELDGSRVRLEVRDDGLPFDPLDHPLPGPEAPSGEGAAGGLGIRLIRSLADEARYERSGGYNLLVLIKRRPGA